VSESDPHEPAPAEAPMLNYSTPVSGKLVVVARFNEYLEAELARNALDGAGIRCIVGGAELTAAGYGPMRGAQVTVYDHDADAARALLDRVAQRRARRIAHLSAPPCPKCGAPGVRKKTRLHFGIVSTTLGLIVLFAFKSPWGLIPLAVGLYALFSLGSSPFRCPACQGMWKASDQENDDEDEQDSEPKTAQNQASDLS
jgi:hypothetical protein